MTLFVITALNVLHISFANYTDRYDCVVSNIATYVGSPGFGSWPWVRLFWLKFRVVFLSFL